MAGKMGSSGAATVVGSAGRTEAEKIDFHIERFKRAIEQCTKGKAREAELRNELRYWEALKAANAMKPGR